MKKLIIAAAAAALLMTGSFKAGQVQQDRSFVERVITRVTDNQPDKYGCIEVVNINNSNDVIAIDYIPGIKNGDRVQVDFKNDQVVHAEKKEMAYYANN